MVAQFRLRAPKRLGRVAKFVDDLAAGFGETRVVASEALQSGRILLVEPHLQRVAFGEPPSVAQVRRDKLLLFAAGSVEALTLGAKLADLVFGNGDLFVETPDLADVVRDLSVDVGDLPLARAEACIGLVEPSV